MKWQPINTAAKDCTEVLLYDEVNGRHYIGSWNRVYKVWDVGAFYFEALEKKELPTHWMPLPKPPRE